MNEEALKLIRELSLSIARQEVVNPFFLELADLLEKYHIRFDTCKNLEILDEYENYIFSFPVRFITPNFLRDEATK